MKAKKKPLVQGWLPEKPLPSLQNNQEIKAAPAGRIGAISARVIGGLGLSSFLAGFILLVAPSFLFPQSYTPKSNSAWGYTSPKTPETWIILAAAIALIVVSVFAFMLYGVKLKTQGSKWMKYTYWVTPGHEAGSQRNLFKVTIAANTLIVGAFLGFTVYVAATAELESLFSSMLIFGVTIALVNLLLHEYGKKKAADQKEISAA